MTFRMKGKRLHLHAISPGPEKSFLKLLFLLTYFWFWDQTRKSSEATLSSKVDPNGACGVKIPGDPT